MKPMMMQHTKSIVKPKKKRFAITLPKIKSDAASEEQELLHCLEKARKELDLVYLRFDEETDQDLLDSYIYEVKALQMKYQYLIKQVKEKGMVAKGFEEIS
jgi:hypothetical protein